MSRRLLTLSALGLTALSPQVHAATNLDNIQALAQNEFRLLSEDLAAILSYKPLSPAAPLGTTGFDLGLEVSDTKLANPQIFDIATSGNGLSSVPLVKAEIQKGLPFGIDIGATYSGVPNSNIKLLGAELRYAIIAGGPATPAVALRASYTSLQGVNQLDFKTTGLDISISKGFAFVTPYAGLGEVWANSTPNGIPALSKENFSLTKYFVGINANFGIVNIAIEGDKTGDATSYGAKFGLRF